MSSTWVFRYAAELIPRSEVCLNQVGSLDASECAISSRPIGVVSSAEGLVVSLGEGAAFSPAAMGNGRVFDRSDVCEFGLRCHERVGLLDGIALDGEALMELLWLGFISKIS